MKNVNVIVGEAIREAINKLIDDEITREQVVGEMKFAFYNAYEILNDQLNKQLKEKKVSRTRYNDTFEALANIQSGFLK